MIERATQSASADGCNSVFANAGSRGYYFTDYPPEAVRALSRNVAGLTPAERISLLGDEWWMVRSGRHDLDAYLDLATALASDDTAAITATLASRLSYIHDFIVDAPDRPRFEEWVRTRFGPSLTALGLPGDAKDGDERQTRRATLLRLVGVTGNDAAVRRTARELALKYIDNPASLPPTLAAPVLEVAAQSGDANLYERYMAQIQKLTGTPEAYYRYFHALEWFTEPALVRRILDVHADATPIAGRRSAHCWSDGQA